jgi:hypothetical protein
MHHFDVIVERHDSLVRLRPLTDEARDWLIEHTDSKARWVDDALMCEQRDVTDLIQELENDRLQVALY